jgi:hypothetical protein
MGKKGRGKKVFFVWRIKKADTPRLFHQPQRIRRFIPMFCLN